MIDGSRLATAGKSHKRRGRPSSETASLLAEYQAAMRDELRACLEELQGSDPPPGLALDGKPAAKERPKLDVRMRLWDLAIKVGRELGTAVDATPATAGAEPAAARPRSRKRIDYG